MGVDRVVALLIGAVLPVLVVGAKAAGGARFSSTINLGAVIVGLLVVIVAGLFTIRSNVAKVWRENFEGEKAKVEQLESELKAEREKTAEQRELKHAAISEAAALRLTDQTAVLRLLATMQEQGQKTTDVAIARLLEGTNEAVAKALEPLTLELRELREKLG